MATQETDRSSESNGNALEKLAALLSPLAAASLVPVGWRKFAPLIHSSIRQLKQSSMEPYIRWLERHPTEIPIIPWQRPNKGYTGQYVDQFKMGPRIELNPFDAIAEALARKPVSLGHEVGHAYVDLAQDVVPRGAWNVLQSFEPSAARWKRSYSGRERDEEAIVRLLEGSLGWPWLIERTQTPPGVKRLAYPAPMGFR